MSRGLDHIVHAVRDLDAAAALYRRLGFTVGARNRHPWGTHNYVIQLPGFFVELLTVAEPEKLSHEGIPLLFGQFHREFLSRREGLSMLVLESKDAAADAKAFTAAGVGMAGPLSFEREAKRPDGSTVQVGFALAFARDEGAPDIAFAACKQSFPENFWNPQFQLHANGAKAIAGVVMVAENPADHHIFLSAITGERNLHATSLGVDARTPRGVIEAMDPTAFKLEFGHEAPDCSRGARLAAMRFAVADVAHAKQVCDRAGIAAESRMGRLVVGPQAALGATLVFEPQAGGGH